MIKLEAVIRAHTSATPTRKRHLANVNVKTVYYLPKPIYRTI